MTSFLSEIQLKGTALSKGVAIGPLFFFTSPIEKILPRSPILKGQVKRECDRFQQALAKCRCDLERIRGRLSRREGAAGSGSHIGCASADHARPGLIQLTEEQICKLCPAEHAFQIVMDRYVDRFNKLKDPFFRERAFDIQDISRRVVSYLCELKFDQWENIREPSILAAEELSSTLVAELSPKRILGLVTLKGSDTSHAAILARAKGIPFISGVNIQNLQEIVQGGENPVILDAREGLIILEPSFGEPQEIPGNEEPV